MNPDEAPDRVFTQPARQIAMMLLVLAAMAAGAVLMGDQLRQLFQANVYLNGFIIFIFLTGVLATFWQVGQVVVSVRWLRNLQAGFPGHEFVRPPTLIASMGPMIREGRMKRRLATSATRSILESISVRLDEARDITRYLGSLLIFLGLLGTFWGLSITVPAVVDTIRSLAPDQAGSASDVSVFDRLMQGLESQLGGMGTAFASSLMGLAGSLVVGLLELFAGHGQNRFYRELEDYLTGFARPGLADTGEGAEGALVALLERVDEGLEVTTNFARAANEARLEAENRLTAAAGIVARMVDEVDREHEAIVRLTAEIREAREHETGRDGEMVALLRSMDQAQAGLADIPRALEAVAAGLDGKRSLSDDLLAELREARGQDATRTEALLATLNRIDEGQQHVAGTLGQMQAADDAAGTNVEMRAHIRSMDRQLRAMAEDVTVGRHETLTALRAEIRALTNLIDMRTRETG